MIDYFMPYGEHFEYYDDINEEEANQLFVISDQIEVPNGIENIKSFDHTKKTD